MIEDGMSTYLFCPNLRVALLSFALVVVVLDFDASLFQPLDNVGELLFEVDLEGGSLVNQTLFAYLLHVLVLIKPDLTNNHVSRLLQIR
jgi:hypothetical protein